MMWLKMYGREQGRRGTEHTRGGKKKLQGYLAQEFED